MLSKHPFRFLHKWSKNLSILRVVVSRIMTKYNKQYIVVKSQYVPHILQYIAICFYHIVTALRELHWGSTDPWLKPQPRQSSCFMSVRRHFICYIVLVHQPKKTHTGHDLKIVDWE